VSDRSREAYPMHKYLIFFSFIATLSFTQFALAEPNANLTLSKYYHASCEAITGTWQGIYTDPTDLYGNGEPWPIRVNLYYQNGRIIGQANNIPPSRNSKIWAQCAQGTLQNIFMGNPGQCGAYSKGGELVSKNILVLYLHTENAMNGTDFLAFLKRVNNSYPYSIPSDPAAFEPGQITSCH